MDERAWFEQTYAEYADFLYRIGRRLLAGRSEDALYDAIQDVFLTMWNKRAELMAHPNPGGWLVTALKYRLLSDGRRTARRGTALSLDDPENPLPVEDAHAPSPEESAMLESHIDQLRALLGEEQTQLFLDYALNGYTAKDLAARCGVSPECIWVRISRLRKRIAQHPEIFYLVTVLLSGFPFTQA